MSNIQIRTANFVVQTKKKIDYNAIILKTTKYSGYSSLYFEYLVIYFSISAYNMAGWKLISLKVFIFYENILWHIN